MTDNEIIKALECCNDCDCKGCPCNSDSECKGIDDAEILDLIKRQQAEIEELQSEITLLKQSNANLQELYQGEKEKVANAKQKVIDIAKALKTAKADAIKEFANRLKSLFNFDSIPAPRDEWDRGYDYAIRELDEEIDGYVKKMLGDTDG